MDGIGLSVWNDYTIKSITMEYKTDILLLNHEWSKNERSSNVLCLS